MAAADSYRWVHDFSRGGACVTVVRGLDVAGVVEALGGDPSVVPQPGDTSAPAAAVGTVGDVVVAVEPGGFQGSRPEVIRPASRSGLAVSVFWREAESSLSRWAFAQEGALVGTFEPGYDRIPAAFARMERVTGVALSLPDLRAITEVWPLVPVLDDLRPAPALRYHPLWRTDRKLVEAVAAAGPQRQRELAVRMAEAAAAAAGVVPDVDGDLGENVAEWARRVVHRNPASPKAWAALAVYWATNPDPLAAALDSIRAATMAGLSRPSPPC